MSAKKTGRPPAAETGRGEMPRITFRIDLDTLIALQELEQIEPPVRGRRSSVLRRLILDARAKQK